MNLSELLNLDAIQARVENAVRFFFDQKRNIIRGEQINSSSSVKILTQNIIRGNSFTESWSIHLLQKNIPSDYSILFYHIFIFIASIWTLLLGFFIAKKLCGQNRNYDDIEDDSNVDLFPPAIAPDEDQPLVPKANDITKEQTNRMENQDQQLDQTKNNPNEEQALAINNEHLPLVLPTNDIAAGQRNRNDDKDQQLVLPTNDITAEQNNKNYNKEEVIPSVSDVHTDIPIGNEPQQLLSPVNDTNEEQNQTISNEHQPFVPHDNDLNEKQNNLINKRHLLSVPIADSDNKEPKTKADNTHQPLGSLASNVNKEGNNSNDNENQSIVLTTNIEQNYPIHNESETMDSLLLPSNIVTEQEENNVAIENNPEINDFSSLGIETVKITASDIKNNKNINKNNENGSNDCKTKPLCENESSSPNKSENNIRDNKDNNIDVPEKTCDSKVSNSPTSEYTTTVNASDANKAINTTEMPAESKNEFANEKNKTIDIEKLVVTTKVDENQIDQKESETFNFHAMQTNVELSSSEKSTETKNDNAVLLLERNINDSPTLQNVSERETPDYHQDDLVGPIEESGIIEESKRKIAKSLTLLNEASGYQEDNIIKSKNEEEKLKNENNTEDPETRESVAHVVENNEVKNKNEIQSEVCEVSLKDENQEKSKSSLEIVRNEDFGINSTETSTENRINETKAEENDMDQSIEAQADTSIAKCCKGKTEDSFESPNKEDKTDNFENVEEKVENSIGEQVLETGESERKDSDYSLNKDELESQDSLKQANEPSCEATQESSENENEACDLVEGSENPSSTDKKSKTGQIKYSQKQKKKNKKYKRGRK